MTDKERQARYVEAQQQIGLKRVRVWVPAGEDEVLREFAEELVARHIRMQILGDVAPESLREQEHPA